MAGPSGSRVREPVIVDPTRREIVAAAVDALRRDGPTGVLLVGEEGTGRSYLLGKIRAELGADVAPIMLNTGRSLRKIPYAALLPQLSQLRVEEVTDRVGVLRALWAQLQRVSEESGQPILLIVDDAKDLDDGSAGLIAEAVTSSWVRLLAAGTRRNGLPGDFLTLWQDGIAERVELPPLTQSESHELVEERLGGRLSAAAARVLHGLSDGIPLHLVALIEEARAAGTLVHQSGIWLLTAAFRSQGVALAEQVASAVEGLNHLEREALTLVALTEPLPRSAARALIAPSVLDRLTDVGWLVDVGEAGLRVRSRLEGDALRRRTSATRRLHLYRHALAVGRDEITQPDNELRLLELALDAGVAMPDAELLAGASSAVRHFESELGLRAAAMIDSDAQRSLARGLVARAYLNLGMPSQALDVLSRGPANPGDSEDVLAGSLVGFTARLALGELDAVDEDALALEKLAEGMGRVAGWSRPGPVLKEAVLRRARLLAAMAAGERADFGAVVEALEADGRFDRGASGPGVERALWIMLESSVDLAAGRFEAAARSAGIALASRGFDDEHFPLSEYGLVRYLAATVLAGAWQDVESLLASYDRAHNRPFVLFGPGLDCVRAYVLLRSGKVEEADELLTDAAQNLDLLDPLQLRGLAWSFAAWAAAAVGHAERAVESLARAEDTAGVGNAALRHLAALHRAGARELLEPGVGLPMVLAMAEEDRHGGLPGWELVARIIGFELGATDDGGRGAELAARAEGPWAAGWGAWSRAASRERAQISGSENRPPEAFRLCAEDYLEAGERFRSLGMLRMARASFARAAGCLDGAGDRSGARRAGAAAAQCESQAGTGDAGDREEAILASLRLSPREQDVVDLAVEGLSDRQIADRLHLSVRTVEGHLHRSYLKLGIRSRDELDDTVRD